MCLKSAGQPWTDRCHRITQWFPCCLWTCFTSQSRLNQKVVILYPWQSFHKKLSFKLFKHPFLIESVCQSRDMSFQIMQKNQFWHIRHIFALKRQKKSTSEKCLQDSYYNIRLSLKLSQNSQIFHRWLFPEKATPELTQYDCNTSLHCSSQSLMSLVVVYSSPVQRNLCSLTLS